MEPPRAVTPLIAGDPSELEPRVASLSALLGALAPASAAVVGAFPIAPGIALVHGITRAKGGLSLRWFHLPHRPALFPGEEGIEAAVLLSAPMPQWGLAPRVASRLMAIMDDPVLRERLRSATTREELVEALARAEADARATSLASGDVLSLLGSRPGGLGAAEAALRLEACGPNLIEPVRRRSLALRLVEQLTGFFAVLLWVGGAFAFLAGMPELGWAIFAVIVVNGLFSFFQEYQAERAVEALGRLLPHEITVRRDGKEVRLPAPAVVPGDVVRLEEGDRVPADGQLLEAAALRVDQSALTGESHPAWKLPSPGRRRGAPPPVERPELVFAGTSVVSGSGALVVHATGMTTEIGGIARLTQTQLPEPSPLQREMARVTRVVTLLAVGFGLGFFLLGVTSGALPMSQGFLFALGVIVANVPEGLLPTLTLALALGVRRLARHRSLMKRLSAVETLGATTVICTDKTGTLTQNRMTARSFWVAGRVRDVGELGDGAPPAVRELFEAAALASQATLEHGDPTEVALLEAGVAAGVPIDEAREAHRLLAPYPFDSFRRRMTLVRGRDGVATAYVKGAPRETLALCDAIREDGRSVPLTGEIRSRLRAEHDRLAAEGLRVLAVASRRLPPEQIGAPAGAVERELVFLGLVALWDPPRPEVAGAVALCRRAGIRVVMVTGDYGLTARAIARDVGLRVEKVVTGEELDRLGPDAVRGLVAQAGVLFARTSPAHKLAIVTALKACGEVVAVTGDGVNDAPALKAADIGVAMGGRGSDVAREAAEMVITDDRFASIVSAIRLGRSIYDNMGKFVTYIFASNVPELVPFLAFVLLGVPLPLTVMQILAVDLGTDMLPALALGAEPPEPGVMDRPPRPRTQRLLGPRRLLRAYAFLGVAEAALSLSAFFWVYWVAGWRPGDSMAASGELYRRATTMTLAGIVAAQIGNVFACRTDRESVFRVGLLRNRLVLWGIAAEVGLLLTLVLVPGLAWAFGLERPRFEEWRLLILFPPAILLMEEARKWIARARHRRRVPGRADPAAQD